MLNTPRHRLGFEATHREWASGRTSKDGGRTSGMGVSQGTRRSNNQGGVGLVPDVRGHDMWTWLQAAPGESLVQSRVRPTLIMGS